MWFPFIVLNWGAGATAVTFRDYFLGTAFGVAAPIVTATWLLGSARELLASWTGPADLLRADILGPLALLVVSLLVPVLLERRRKAAIRAAEGAAGEGKDGPGEEGGGG
jgi:uncharacterized membrane protein YdjX (TVP38/TMEM64 family)